MCEHVNGFTKEKYARHTDLICFAHSLDSDDSILVVYEALLYPSC